MPLSALLTVLVLSDLACAESAPQLRDIGTARITVDGDLAEWPAALRLELRAASNVAIGAERWAGPDDLSGVVRVAYDARNVYVGAEVTTPAPLQNFQKPRDAWDGDSVELFLNLDEAHPSRSFSKGNEHIRLIATDGGIVYSATRDEVVAGAVLAVRRAAGGYQLEASIPLEAFPGAHVRPGGRFGIDVGINSCGPGQRRRTLLMTASGTEDSVLDVDRWLRGRLGGRVDRRVPLRAANKLRDGTEGVQLLHSSTTLTGRVIGADGGGLAGVRVSTWPRSAETITGAGGHFVLPNATVYTNSIVTVRRDGLYSTLAAWDRLAEIHMEPLPDVRHRVPPRLFGHNYWMWLHGSPVDNEVERVRTLGLQMLRFGGNEVERQPDQAFPGAFERFIHFASAVGAEPLVQVSVREGSPERSAALVRRARERGWEVRYWSVGNEEDAENTPVATYASDVREHIIAMKLADPTILVTVGELAWKYRAGVDDWVTPLVAANADVLNFFSIHRYLFGDERSHTVANVVRASARNEAVFAHVQGLIGAASDVTIPLMVTEANIGATGDPNVAQGEAGAATFWAGYHVAELYGIGMRRRLASVQPWSLVEGWTLSAIDEHGPKPSFYGAQMVARHFGDIPVEDVTSSNPALRVYATRHSTDRSHAVLVLNGGDTPEEAVLKLEGRRVRRVYAPASITMLRVAADGTIRALIYTRAMADSREAPAWEAPPG